MMQQRPRGVGGGGEKCKAMERLMKFNKTLSGLDTAKSTDKHHPQLINTSRSDPFQGKINVPASRMKPQYKMTLETGGVAKQVLAADRNKSKEMPKHVDTNNNNSNSINVESKSKRLFDHSSDNQGRMSGCKVGTKAETLKDKVVKCICNRPKTYILCTICGYSTFGHIRTPCFAHLRVTYLLDMACCPRCNSGRLMEVSPLEPDK